MTFNYSRGRNIRDTRPRQMSVATVAEFASALELDDGRAEQKKESAYIAGPLNGEGHRCAKGALPVSWIALDLDRIDPEVLPNVRLYFARFSGMAWPTHSSVPSAPRERVIIFFDRDVTRSERIAIGAVLLDDLATEFGDAVLLDDSTHRPEQPVFLPPPGVRLAHFSGDELRADRFLQAALPTSTAAIARPVAVPVAGMIREPGRHQHLTRLFGTLNRKHAAAETIVAALLAENAQRCTPPLLEGEVRKLAASMLLRYAEERRPEPAQQQQAEPSATPSEDAVALAFVELHDDHRFVVPLHRWLRWDGMRWREDSAGHVYQRIRELVRSLVQASKAERSTANAAFVSGVERLLRTDPAIALVTEQLDAEPWALNTRSGIVDLRTGAIGPHDPARLFTRLTGAAVDAGHGAELWRQFLDDITLGDTALAEYLQRVAGYCATGVTTEDVLVYLFGIGANGKGSFAEAIASALGDYAKVFAPEVLMEAKGERHPTELAQFLGVRFALTSEPSSGAVWNDSRIKALTGDATISARFMRADNFTFDRTHKTMVLGNHMPRLAEVTHAIRRRVQMTPFRAVFAQTAGPEGMRERLKAEASGAVLAWIVEGTRAWLRTGTAPPDSVQDLTKDYLSDQDVLGQWLDEQCERAPAASERLSALHQDYVRWSERQGAHPKSNLSLSAYLVSAGFRKASTAVGKLFYGLRKKLE